eukprot:4196222-Pleurochrysis_carterae.AAC.1
MQARRAFASASANTQTVYAEHRRQCEMIDQDQLIRLHADKAEALTQTEVEASESASPCAFPCVRVRVRKRKRESFRHMSAGVEHK